MLARSFAAAKPFLQIASDFTFLYPHGFLDSVLLTQTKDKKELAVLYALMREESSFIPDIVSPAGAVGLMQLLPSTAADIAARTAYGSFDLTNSTDNMILGCSYFKYLLRVVKSPIAVFIAYNGGLGNFWKWEKEFDMSDAMIFADSLPFRETRNYVRKLMSSSIIYGMLYYDIPARDMITYLSEAKK